MAKTRAITGLDPLAPVEKNARLMVRERLADMYAYATYAQSLEQISGLHDLRIAAKRLRYTLEIFAHVLPEAGKDFAEELARLQNELGDLHDSEVMLALVHQCLQGPGTKVSKKTAGKPRLLVTPDLLELIQADAKKPGLSAQTRQGLERFLYRQEERRVQSYNAFRQHWDKLEARHFRSEIEEMLDRDEEDESEFRRS